MKIAEGCGHDRSSEFAQCLGQARGTGVELEYALLLSRDLDLIQPEAHDTFQNQVIDVRRMLSGLIRAASGTAI
jgi:four helix bundle protein